MDNCNNIYNLGCFPTCEDITTPIIADSNGIYEMTYERRGWVVRHRVSVISGSAVVVPAVALNENSIMDLEFKKNGSSIYVTVDGVDYCKFRVTVKPMVTI